MLKDSSDELELKEVSVHITAHISYLEGQVVVVALTVNAREFPKLRPPNV